MKKKRLQSLFLLIFLLCLTLAFLGYGCGGNGGVGRVINKESPLSLSGKAFFRERQVYANIPIFVKNLLNETVAVTTTDISGYYSFTNIQPGTYYLSATTGESEVTFGNMVQVTDQGATEIEPVSLLCINNVIVDSISSNSFHLEFRTNQSCTSLVRYSATGGYEITREISKTSKNHHDITITDLNALTNYEISIDLVGNDGQKFTMNGLTAHTIGFAGCSNISVNIDNGAYETINQTVTLSLNAKDCYLMRISEDYSMDESSWIAYSQNYTHNFSNTSSGIKRLYVQFRDKSGLESPIISDSIVYTTSGYLGVWINNGEAITNQSTVEVKAVCPGATHMLISDNPNFSNSFWETYVALRKWQFNSTEGIKYIYCKFKGGAANPEEVFKTSILYDNSPPKVEVIINNGVKSVATNTVEIQFRYTSLPSYMKISNTTAPTSSDDWQTFKTPIQWTLPLGDGEKTVYAIFKDDAGNEYGPVEAEIAIDTVAPTGNTIAILESDNPSSQEISKVLYEKLPAYLHFNISDDSTKTIYYHIGLATSTIPTEYNELSYPANPISLNTDILFIGNIRIWAYFVDEAGNKSPVSYVSLEVEGAEIIVSPSIVGLRASGEQSFSVTYNNLDEGDIGSIKWIASGPGRMTQENAVYKAPNIIWEYEEVTIIATPTHQPKKISYDIFGIATVSLQATPQVVYLQNNGTYTTDFTEMQIEPNGTAIFNVYVIPDTTGIRITSVKSLNNRLLGTATVVYEEAPYGSIATITYIPNREFPEEADNDEVTINFQTQGSSPIAGKVNVVIFHGAKIILTGTSDITQKGTELVVSPNISNTGSSVVHWELSPPYGASFSDDEDNPQSATDTLKVEKVKIYSLATDSSIPTTLTASIDGAKKTYEFTAYPPLKLRLNINATDAMPLADPMIFTATFDFVNGSIDETIDWTYKNANRKTPMPANGNSYADRGTLTQQNNYQVEYKRPTNRPSEDDKTASDIVEVYATSRIDPNASDCVRIRIREGVVVEIFKDIQKNEPITDAYTNIEVGTLQFYVKVTPEIINNTSVTWTVNGVTSSDIYGSIDSNGKYTAPSSYESNSVTVRATSNYNPSVFKDVTVHLSEFWKPIASNMKDEDTEEPMPISKVFVDPSTSKGKDFVVYAGTGAENQFGYYGLWYAKFPDSETTETEEENKDWWIGVGGLSSRSRTASLSYLIYDITMDKEKNIYVSTGSGIFYIDLNSSDPNNQAILLNLTSGANIPPLTSLVAAFDNYGNTLLLAGSKNGVYSFTIPKENPYKPWVVSSRKLLIDTKTPYREQETRTEIVKVIENGEEKDVEDKKTAYSNNLIPNPISSAVRSLRFDSLNKSLYFGTSSGRIYHCESLEPNMENINADVFLDSSSIKTVSTNVDIYPDLSYPPYGEVNGVPLAIALDVINTNTLWTATTSGVSRSIDYGSSWSSFSFGGVDTNSKCIIVELLFQMEASAILQFYQT